MRLGHTQAPSHISPKVNRQGTEGDQPCPSQQAAHIVVFHNQKVSSWFFHPAGKCCPMPTRLSKKNLGEAENLNSLAAHIMAPTTGREPPKPPAQPVREKNVASVALGKLGASKGGKARALSLSKTERMEIAKLAAAARWKKSEH